ncbi:MAG: LytTR family DNA-binding domain-containing protein [Cyclobacteriaceae bacterium]|nr:LytTR family DNA-binding domain-containing protein [Cyclobacteriaceae bacterium]
MGHRKLQRDYALQGYELDVVDHLLKPFSFQRFFKAVNKAQNFLSKLSEKSGDCPYIYLKLDKRVERVNLQDILYIESMKDYIKVKTCTQEVVSHQKISYMEEHLPADKFLRVHRSFIISLSNIDAYSASNVEIGGFSVPIGRNYKEKVMPRLNRNII